MIGENHLCTICSSEESIQGCLCDGAITLIGTQCFIDHLTNTDKDHNSIKLDLASRMHHDPSLIDFYLEERFEIFKLLKGLRKNLNKSEHLKKQFSEYKTRLISCIEIMSNQTFIEIEGISHDIREKIKIINNYRANLSGEGKVLMDKYKNSGIDGLVKNFKYYKDIPIDEVLEYLATVFNMKQGKLTTSCSLAEKDHIIDDLKSKLAENEIRCKTFSDSYNLHIAQKDKLIEELDLKLKMRDEEYSFQISKLETQNEELKSLIQKRDNEIFSLNSHLSEIKRSYEELQTSRNKAKEIHDLKLELQNKTTDVKETQTGSSFSVAPTSISFGQQAVTTGITAYIGQPTLAGNSSITGSGTRGFKYKPARDTEHGTSYKINHFMANISFTEKSVEEYRLEDYKMNITPTKNTGEPARSLFGQIF